MNDNRKPKLFAQNSHIFLAGVMRCYFSHHEYILLEHNKGKQKAFVKGWKCFENGGNKNDCQYLPNIKKFIPTNPYFKYWHLGFECAHKHQRNLLVK